MRYQSSIVNLELKDTSFKKYLEKTNPEPFKETIENLQTSLTIQANQIKALESEKSALRVFVNEMNSKLIEQMNTLKANHGKELLHLEFRKGAINYRKRSC